MHVIIDGYNLLGFAGRMGRASGTRVAGSDMEAAREALLRDLAAYRHRKNHAVTVVFDGWQQGFSVERHEHRTGVEVIYSRRGEKADAVIQRLAAQFGTEAAVVSSDHEVANFARAHGAFILSAAEFAASLSGPVPSAHAGTAVAWKEKKEDDRPVLRRSEKKGNPRKLPKRLRQRQQRLKRF
jgi:predicted RNA-binding protein with PIN domain